MKRTFEIEFPDDCGPLWMNTSNLLLCLTSYCRNTRFTVRDVTGDGQAVTDPETAGPAPEMTIERAFDAISQLLVNSDATVSQCDHVIHADFTKMVPGEQPADDRLHPERWPSAAETPAPAPAAEPLTDEMVAEVLADIILAHESGDDNHAIRRLRSIAGSSPAPAAEVLFQDAITELDEAECSGDPLVEGAAHTRQAIRSLISELRERLRGQA